MKGSPLRGGEECWTLEKKGEDLKIVSETRRVDGPCRALWWVLLSAVKCLLVQILVQAENITLSPKWWFFLNCVHKPRHFYPPHFTLPEQASMHMHRLPLCFLSLKAILFLVSVTLDL